MIYSKKISDIAVLKSSTKSICFIYNTLLPTRLTVDDLLNSVKFDNSFKQSKRMTAYFGLKDYAYSNTYHTKQPIAANPLIKSCFDEIDKLFPEAKVNTVLLNYYPDGSATIPFHSDNEPEICQNSFILTLSIGHTRTLVFREIRSKKHLCNITLEHNSLIFFTKASQFLYEHSISSQTLDCIHDSRRISLTFRKIK